MTESIIKLIVEYRDKITAKSIDAFEKDSFYFKSKHYVSYFIKCSINYSIERYLTVIWHNCQNNPNDLPIQGKEVLVIGIDDKKFLTTNLTTNTNIKGWCYIEDLFYDDNLHKELLKD